MKREVRTISKRMVVSVSHRGISVLYRCFHLPDYGKKCKDRYTDQCYRCRYCKAEMSADDATTLMRRQGDEDR